MPKPKVTKEDAVAAITETFRKFGYGGASLAKLSAASGLGKSSLYHHFPKGKEDMAAAAREHVIDRVRETFLDSLNGEGDPVDRLAEARKGLESFYGGGSKACLIDLFGIADAVEALPGTASAMAEAMTAGFAKLAQDAGATRAEAIERAELAVIELEGALVLARALGTSQPFFRVLGRLEKILLSKD
ncbi:TetR/AcrR family transcriptional regulator [Parvularcula lutaonensis]|uniref:TetR/AcrR family transcriptional regulator n=1 Tax=Parvularcula lutaonensis TaxID=491923 RepID=A0ABV7M9K2_9PROT|nr:TetR/AcrR family transcriptional regulator [Parvularcula lutaonensis]GGY46992.1 TetR family transcriptional regulator [Parvularcula lutaonensis]